MRSDGRGFDKLRNVTITTDFVKHAEGSCLIELGNTRVICTATVEESVPPFLRNSLTGWVTAEYGMIPRSCTTRLQRHKQSGRTFEIQRLIGRSLRAVVDFKALGERTVILDCDVIQADGGTRTASITGGFVALVLALAKIKKAGTIRAMPIRDYVAATSAGIIGGKAMVDLNYEEDSKADVDMNVVMTGSGKMIEVQGTAERDPFSKQQLDSLLQLTEQGIQQLIEQQRSCAGRYLDR